MICYNKKLFDLVIRDISHRLNFFDQKLENSYVYRLSDFKQNLEIWQLSYYINRILNWCFEREKVFHFASFEGRIYPVDIAK